MAVASAEQNERITKADINDEGTGKQPTGKRQKETVRATDVGQYQLASGRGGSWGMQVEHGLWSCTYEMLVVSRLQGIGVLRRRHSDHE
jgi:hypothetical protein